jgi:hypothetical protein
VRSGPRSRCSSWSVSRSAAPAQWAVSSNDNKVILGNGVVKVMPDAAPDTLTIIDLGGGTARPCRTAVSASRPTGARPASAPSLAREGERGQWPLEVAAPLTSEGLGGRCPPQGAVVTSNPGTRSLDIGFAK